MINRWRWPAIGAVATIVIALSFALVPGINACGSHGATGSWVAFQKVTSVYEVQQLIRPQCAPQLVPALRASMWLDALAFIPAYGLMLGSLLLTLTSARWLRFAGLLLLGGGMLADQIEGVTLLAILDNLPGFDEQVLGLIFTHAAKELLLASATAVVAAAALPLGGWRRGAAILALIAALAAIGLIVIIPPLAATAMLVAWLALAAISLGSWWSDRPVTAG